MKSVMIAMAVVLPLVAGVTVSPTAKVLQLLADVQAKVVSEGTEAKKTYEEFAEYCDDRSKDLAFAIKTGQGEAAELTAAIQKADATLGSLEAKIEQLVADIATDDADLKAAAAIRAKEAADFAKEEKELSEIISMLQRAVGILQREMAKGGAAMLQLKSAKSVTQALEIMVQASVFSSADGSRLTALVQQTADSDEADDGAPDAAVYEGHSGGIVDTLESLLEKAEAQLADARTSETKSSHNYDMVKQSLDDEVKFATKDMDGAKADHVDTTGAKATATGDLDVTTKSLNADIKALADLKQVCASTAADYEAGVKSRNAEITALTAAHKVISEMTGGADTLTYGLNQVSLLQQTSSGSVGRAAVRFVRDLAKKESSPALAQLASRMTAAMRSSGGDDPFGKVKTLITNMIAKLESEQDAEATEKAYCDKELGETNVKKDDKTAEIQKLSTQIDQMSARSAQLKQEAADTLKALASLAAAQADMDKIRSEQNADFTSNKADLEQGIAGVKQALKILREYYASEGKAHAAAEGAGAGVIGLLEVCESDFTAGLAAIMSAEENAAAEYVETSKANEVEKAAKDQDVKYKTKESAALDKAVGEDTADRSGVQTELVAVMDYLKTMEKRCIAKPETYAERARRREAEIAGLKEALSILEGEASLVQRASKHMLRGVHLHRNGA